MADQIMAEGKVKKPGILRRIFWWLWVILLTALLVLGLVFAAPWKVITLIVIFLAAATILPKIYRKWFWATVCLAVTIFAVWVLMPTEHDGWEMYKYDFSSQLAKLEQERAIPPADNAAPDYLALLKEDAGDDANLTDRFYAVYKSPWKSSDHPEAAKSLEKHSQTIKKLMEISQKPECRFPLDKPYNELNSARYGAFLRWGDLLTAACNNDVGERRIEQALEKYTVIAQIGRHHIQQGTAIDMSLGISFKSRAYRLVRPLIMNGLDEEKLALVQNTICAPDNNWENAWPRMLEYDKLLDESEIAKYYEVNRTGRIRLSRDPRWPERIGMRKALNESYSDVNDSSIKQLLKPLIYRIAYPSWLETKLIKAGTFVRWLFLPASPLAALNLLNSCSDENVYTDGKTTKSGPTKFPFLRVFNKKRGILAMARVQDSSHQSMLYSYNRLTADRKGTLLLAALKHYKDAFGTWPQNLAEIKPLASPDTFIDPLNNGEFVYKLTADGFTLYSRGKNGIDEGGEYETKFNKTWRNWETIKDDWMIWPIKSKICP